MFKVNNKNTRMTYFTSMTYFTPFSSADFEHVNVCWENVYWPFVIKSDEVKNIKQI